MFIIIILNYFIYSSLFAGVLTIREPFSDVTLEDILMIQTEIEQFDFELDLSQLNEAVRFIAIELNNFLDKKNVFSEENTL